MKILYGFPAFIVCLIFLFLLSFAGGIGAFGFMALVFLALPILAAVLLCMGKWWGAFSGMILGAMLLYSQLGNSGGEINLIPVASVIIVYYAAMGFICYRLNRN